MRFVTHPPRVEVENRIRVEILEAENWALKEVLEIEKRRAEEIRTERDSSEESGRASAGKRNHCHASTASPYGGCRSRAVSHAFTVTAAASHALVGLVASRELTLVVPVLGDRLRRCWCPV